VTFVFVTAEQFFERTFVRPNLLSKQFQDYDVFNIHKIYLMVSLSSYNIDLK